MLSAVPRPVVPPSFWVASTKPEAVLRRAKVRNLGEEEGGLWRSVIAGQKPACTAGWGTYLPGLRPFGGVLGRPLEWDDAAHSFARLRFRLDVGEQRLHLVPDQRLLLE
jgi:hypothetical protein